MSFLLENWILIVVALGSGAMLAWPALRGAGAGVGGASVSTGEAVRLINRERGVLVDVCEPQEYAAAHAGGARNIPFGRLEGSKDLPTNKTLPLLVICASGARSSRAASLLRKAGYANAVSVAGGTRAWREAQLPIERGEGAEKADKPGKSDRSTKNAKLDRNDKAATADSAAAADGAGKAANSPAS
ncbi:MAG: rhodanese-like domain-containing protein [Burkholderiales bacterium]|nr:rhodanese-like domain-containing protein [Burkholderiales bacterium]